MIRIVLSILVGTITINEAYKSNSTLGIGFTTLILMLIALLGYLENSDSNENTRKKE